MSYRIHHIGTFWTLRRPQHATRRLIDMDLIVRRGRPSHRSFYWETLELRYTITRRLIGWRVVVAIKVPS